MPTAQHPGHPSSGAAALASAAADPHTQGRSPRAIETAIEVGFVLFAVTVGILLSI
ncbi:MAG: hypothetical protein AAF108_11030 [Planctomycetota bacterium]